MKAIRRIFLIVLDSVGIGSLPDAALYGDEGANTLKTISSSPKFHIPNLKSLGYLNIDGIELDGTENPRTAYCRLKELSKGKDTTIGHWEISGVVSNNPLPVFPHGFPKELVDRFERLIGSEVLCNKPYSGTEVIRDYGEEHIRTGKPILYTSADSVFQVAAHETYYGLDRLYEICSEARELLTGKWGVGRVIARTFIGETKETFARTSNRHDYALKPPAKTVLDVLSESGMDVIAVGKIHDIFAGQGITKTVRTKGNADGMAKTSDIAHEDFNGMCFVNLVDFDMVYGHRNDVDGYANALSEFDEWLGGFLTQMNAADILMITADHGCDPGYPGTDHTREYIPLLVYGKHIMPVNLGTRDSFADIAATAAVLLGADGNGICGSSFAESIIRR